MCVPPLEFENKVSIAVHQVFRNLIVFHLRAPSLAPRAPVNAPQSLAPDVSPILSLGIELTSGARLNTS